MSGSMKSQQSATLSQTSVPLVILAGGLGTRMGLLTENVPKPMLEIHGRPMLLHIMLHYAHFGVTEFHILAGYKSGYIKDYFASLVRNFCSIRLTYGKAYASTVKTLEDEYKIKDWNVFVHETGYNSKTGERLKRIKDFLPNDFYFTYGDSLSDFDPRLGLADLRDHKATVAICAVTRGERFGSVSIDGGSKVIRFQEKISSSEAWINGGFMSVSSKIFEFITGTNDSFESDVIPRVVQLGQVSAVKHSGFWTAIDHERELSAINSSEWLPWQNTT